MMQHRLEFVRGQLYQAKRVGHTTARCNEQSETTYATARCVQTAAEPRLVPASGGGASMRTQAASQVVALIGITSQRVVEWR